MRPMTHLWMHALIYARAADGDVLADPFLEIFIYTDFETFYQFHDLSGIRRECH